MNFYSTLSSAQIPLINTSWEQVTGLPVDYDWSATAVDNSSNLFVVGNTSTMDEGANILLTKYNSSGVQQWQVEWNGTTDGNDYGVSLLLGSSAIFVAGATYNETNADYDWVINKYNPSNGSLTWSYIYSDAVGGHDIPADMVLDTAGNLIITGARQGSTTLADMCTVKLNSSGTHQWTSTYDYSGYQDAGAKIVLVSADGVMVTGGSGNSWTAGDIATVRYASNGTQASTNRTTNSAVGFDLPMDMKRDADNNIYIVGRVATVSNGTDIKLLKLDEDLDVVWTETVDGYGEDDCGNALVLDDSGDLTVTGYMTNANGKKELCLVSFENDGDYKWHLTRPSAYGGHAEGNALLLNDDRILVTGYYEGEFGKEIITVSYDDQGNQRWLKLFGGGAGNTAIGQHIKRSVANTYYVSGTIVTGGVQRYVSIKYAEWEQPFVPAVGEDSTATHVHGEAIISFSPQYILQDAVNDRGKIFGSLAEFVTQQMIDSMNAALGADVKFNKVVKVFRNFTVADSLSVTRLGDTITIPPIWSTLVFTFNHAWADTTVISALNDLWPMIEYAEVNGLGRLDSNDPFYVTDQASLLEISGDGFENADINIEPAWEIETGKSYVKVGIYDTHIMWWHEDLIDSNNDPVVIGGWDYISQQQVYTVLNIPFYTIVPPQQEEFDYNHGTAVSGIIAGVRNNEKGIAGIAGGSDGSPKGVSLVSMRIAGNPQGSGLTTGDGFVPWSTVISAIVVGAWNYNGMGYGMHIQNHSWGHPETSFCPYPSACLFESLRKAIDIANRNGCTVICSRGNWGNTDPQYPACFEDEWVISVGASGTDGTWKDGSTNGSGFPSSFGQLDVIAPGTIEIIKSLLATGTSAYGSLGNSSAATAHVSGLAALALSQHNTQNPDAAFENNLAPEDVEQLIERYASDIDSTYSNDPPFPMGYDIYNGWGRINAGATMDKLKWPEYRIWHSPAPSSTSVSTGSVTSINLEQSWNVNSFGTFPAGTYPAALTTVTHTYNISFGENIEIIGGWGRRSSTIGFNSLTDVDAYHRAFWSFSIDSNSAVVTATTHCWQMTNSFWIPAHPSQLKTPFSLHLRDLSVSNVSESASSAELQFYPIPATDLVNLRLKSGTHLKNVQVTLYNIDGRPVLQVNWPDTGSDLVLTLSGCSPGLYIAEISTPGYVRCAKVVKN